MKTIERIVADYKSETVDGRDFHRLAMFTPEAMLPEIGYKLKDEFVGKHAHIPLTKENVLKQLEEDVAFGFNKALGQRGLSAGLMYQVVSMWNWILEEGLEDFDKYAQYGLPLFKATAIKYGFDNPIGNDKGSEKKYSSN